MSLWPNQALQRLWELSRTGCDVLSVFIWRFQA
jgi:hypothetical protein